MQGNTITLSVDVANDGNPVSQVFTRDLEEPNRTTYNGPEHALDSQDTLTLTRTAPVRSGEMKGVARSSIKFNQKVAVPNVSGDGNVDMHMVAECRFSIPLGCTAAQTKELRQRVIALLDDDSVSGALVDLLSI